MAKRCQLFSQKSSIIDVWHGPKTLCITFSGLTGKQRRGDVVHSLLSLLRNLTLFLDIGLRLKPGLPQG